MLERDLERFARGINRLCPVPLTQGQYDAWFLSRLTPAVSASARYAKNFCGVITKAQRTSSRDGCLLEGAAWRAWCAPERPREICFYREKVKGSVQHRACRPLHHTE